MTETNLCGYCVDLPENGRAAAAQVNRCPLCKTELGITAGGRRFRIDADAPAARRSGIGRIALGGVATAGLAALGWIALQSDAAPEYIALPPPPAPIVESPPAPVPLPTPPPADVATVKRYAEGVQSPEARVKPQIGPLVAMPSRADVAAAPGSAKAASELPADTGKQVGRVDASLWRLLPSFPPLPTTALRDEYDLLTTPEIGLAQVRPRRASEFKGHSAEWQTERKDAKLRLQELAQKIHAKNGVAPDGFIRALAKEQPELAGLPFRLGNSCRLATAESKRLGESARAIRCSLALAPNDKPGGATFGYPRRTFWHQLERVSTRGSGSAWEGKRPPAALLPGLVQILAVEPPALRVELIAHYREVQEASVTRLLARLALFDPEKSVRAEALCALKPRPAAQYAETLFDGLSHPWPAVAQRAADAIVFLKRKDAAVRLAGLLRMPDPCAAFEQTTGGKKVLVVREMVKINHHRNCLLCHAPLQTNLDAPDTVNRKELLTLPLGLVPVPTEELPPSGIAYYDERNGETAVRADVTYLRQDFSMLLPVEDPAPWPMLQRFDFLVRTRVLTADELRAAQSRQRARPASYLSPQHRAILSALRGLAALDVGKADGRAD